MITKISKLILLLSLMILPLCAEIHSDAQLLEIGKQAFKRWGDSKNRTEKIQILKDEFAPLTQAQRTRAMIFAMYDLDANSRRPGKNLWPSALLNVVMMDDPSLLTDPSELEAMIAAETDPRKFYTMATPASLLMSGQGADFVAEISHMLFLHGPVASTAPSDYYRPSLEDVSYFAYEMIVKNLGLLKAEFVPPDENLPYEKRIPVLMDWLRHNWPGCEKLGLEEKADFPSPAPEAMREEKRPRGDLGSAARSPKEKSWLETIVGGALIGMMSGAGIILYNRLKRKDRR